MSNNATRFQSMNTQRVGLAAYLGITEQVQAEQSREQMRAQMRAALDALEWEQAMAPYKNAFAYTHLADMSEHLDPKSEVGMHPVICYRATPVIVAHKRVGHRMTITEFVY